MTRTDTMERALHALLTLDDTFRTKDALAAGVHPRVLYAMRDLGLIEPLARGLYRMADAPPLSEPDLITVAHKVPRGVICLVSALAFHELTTAVPHEVHVALPRDVRRPRLAYPPIRVYRFSEAAYEAGVETHNLDDSSVRVYSVEKTVADCFKYRNKLGLETVLEAVRLYRERHSVDVDALLRFARVCRVERVARPYLEALL